MVRSSLSSPVITQRLFVGAAGAGLLALGLAFPVQAAPALPSASVAWPTSGPQASMALASCQPATYGFQSKSYAEEAREREVAFARAEAARRANAWPTEFVKITKDIDDPNSVKIPFAQAPGISAETRRENGRRVCLKENDKGNKSKQDKDVHIDRECCLDPDEIPNPRCYYPKLGDQNAPERVVGADGKKYIK